jgi:hypothetical protein
MYVCVTDNAGGKFCDPETVTVTVAANNVFNLTLVSRHHISQSVFLLPLYLLFVQQVKTVNNSLHNLAPLHS